ncbi:alpha/beta hydrolase [Streptomyces orinoci]|uniref:Alpha/beta hydrolase-fold protein n=1 Tax=Streptomyces orinoci TaxID=67339 RepID=A0ABV3K3Q7_STRON|nr:alpha/beta hydrolase-fold protein [Streptomyces orinoci]
MTHSAHGAYRSRGHRRAALAKRWILVALCITVLGGIVWPVLDHFGVFSDQGEAISFDQDNKGGGQGGGQTGGSTGRRPGESLASLPTGPKADFTIAGTVPEDGTKIAVTTLAGRKSGFTGKVWVWVPKEYREDPRYATSGFPVMIALPGGPGYPANYWMGTNLGLQASISRWFHEGRSLPFILAMPVLNPHPDDGGLYWDGSDIPGQPRMGTWLTEDVPDLIRANFRTIKSRDGWCYMGSSTGGFAGLKSVLQKPDKFKAVIASGPDLVPDSRLWHGHEREQAANTPAVLAQRLIAAGGPEVYLAFQVGTVGSDARAKGPIEDFVAHYGRGPVKTRLSVIQGGRHDAASYVPNMARGQLVQWISEHMQGPVRVRP